MTTIECSFSSEISATGKQWQLPTLDDRLILALTQRYQLPDIIGRLLVNRGITLETAENYLRPKLMNLMPDPFCLLDMDKAVQRVLEALIKRQKIVVYGDYDVDGACASALLRHYFSHIHHPIDLYIPDRIEEGYGANAQALEDLHKKGAHLILMVDCGTTAFAPLSHAQDRNLDVIIFDHHTAEPKLPPVEALVNPNRLDQDTKTTALLGSLCAAGVTYLFLVALQRALRQQNWFVDQGIGEPNLLTFLDLVALATVCDVMPLTGLNRGFVAQGLKVLRQRHNVGLKVLADVAGVAEAITTYHLGFILGPRINAGGRVGQADLGSRLLTSTDSLQAKDLATQLHQFNQHRQDIEKDVLEKAIEQVETLGLTKNPVLLVSGSGWHPGVIGIVASRLKERYNRPACVVGFDGDNGKGSGRSVGGVCLGTAMHLAVHKGLLEKGGGHAMAAGFSVHKRTYEAFYDFLNQHLGKPLQTYAPTLRLDGYLSVGGVTPDLLEKVQHLEPYGQGNSLPRFAFSPVQIGYLDTVGENHLRCQITDQAGHRLKAMAFRSKNTALGDYLENAFVQKRLIQVAGTVHLTSWLWNQQIVLYIEDAMKS